MCAWWWYWLGRCAWLLLANALFSISSSLNLSLGGQTQLAASRGPLGLDDKSTMFNLASLGLGPLPGPGGCRRRALQVAYLARAVRE